MGALAFIFLKPESSASGQARGCARRNYFFQALSAFFKENALFGFKIMPRYDLNSGSRRETTKSSVRHNPPSISILYEQTQREIKKNFLSRQLIIHSTTRTSQISMAPRNTKILYFLLGARRKNLDFSIIFCATKELKGPGGLLISLVPASLGEIKACLKFRSY